MVKKRRSWTDEESPVIHRAYELNDKAKEITKEMKDLVEKGTTRDVLKRIREMADDLISDFQHIYRLTLESMYKHDACETGKDE